LTPDDASRYSIATSTASFNVRKRFDIQRLNRIAIIGVGLLGGSVGLALRAAGFKGVRVGAGRRASSLENALRFDAVDEATLDMHQAVRGAEAVILCTPISRFAPLLKEIAPALMPGVIITDVGSTKTEVLRTAERILPRTVQFIGSHPIAGSEKTGVEFSRADLFDRALCLVTPGRRTTPQTTAWATGFWEALGGQTIVLDAARHDQLLGQVSHLPHAVAAALVALAVHGSAIDFAGPGFGDTTRVASGDPTMWTDIFRTNRRAVGKAIDGLVKELLRFRGYLKDDNEEAIRKWLAASKDARDRWVAQRYRKQVMT
jgi:prephenate dehydrogenase